MKRELLAGTYIQADETPVGVRMHGKRDKNDRSSVWQCGWPGKSIVFDSRMGRSGDGAKQFLGRFNGLL